jgi:hypothetical protein
MEDILMYTGYLLGLIIVRFAWRWFLGVIAIVLIGSFIFTGCGILILLGAGIIEWFISLILCIIGFGVTIFVVPDIIQDLYY